VGVGNNVSYYTYDGGGGAEGSGGAFTGEWAGVAGWGLERNAVTVGVYGRYDGGGNADGKGVYGYAYNSHSNRGYGVYGQGNRYAVYANGDLGASGSKSFEIDHPLDPENKILKHYSIESPEVLNMYRGNVTLDNSGQAIITLPEYFIAININFSYSLTAIGQQAPNIHVSQEIGDEGSFSISGGNPGQKISWVVYAERNDLHMQKNRYKEQAEIDKEDDWIGKYLRPELYNQPPEMGIHYIKGKVTHDVNRSAPLNNELKQYSLDETNIEEVETLIIEEKPLRQNKE